MSRMPPPPTMTPEMGGGIPSTQANGFGGITLPAPAQPPSPSAMQDMNDVMAIVDATRSIADRHPTAVPVVKQINDLVQQLQMQMIQAAPPSQVAAPPV